MKEIYNAEAKSILLALRVVQEAGRYNRCPRCGSARMAKPFRRNALSRRIQLYICDVCGAKEAINDYHGTALPFNLWDAAMGKDDAILAGCINSDHGFYIGDIGYVLEDRIFDDFWGDECGNGDGIHMDPVTELEFAVAGTAYGDGCYADNNGNEYPVDGGVIGLVPLELVTKITKDEARHFGAVREVPGVACFLECGGMFSIILPDGKEIVIDTAKYSDKED